MNKEELQSKINELKKQLPMLCDSDYYKQCNLIEQLELELKEVKIMNKTFKEYEEENTIICPNCNVKIKTNIIPMNFFDNIHEDMYISHEAEYLERKKLQDRINKAIELLDKFIPEDDDTILFSNNSRRKLRNILKGEE